MATENAKYQFITHQEFWDYEDTEKSVNKFNGIKIWKTLDEFGEVISNDSFVNDKHNLNEKLKIKISKKLIYYYLTMSVTTQPVININIR